MFKEKIYKSSKSHSLKHINDRGFREHSSIDIYIYLYNKSSFLFTGNNDEHIKNFIKRINKKNEKASLSYGYDSHVASKGSFFGELEKSFMIEYFVDWSSIFFDKKEIEYTVKSIGMLGEYIDENKFSAKFYDCFGDIIFMEDTYNLIHNVFPKDEIDSC